MDDSRNIHTISFERVTRKDIYIQISIRITDDFADDSEDIIKANLVDFISGFSNGEGVYLSALYSYINITGVRNVESLELSTDGETYSAANITCTSKQIARTSADKIFIYAYHV